MTAVAGVNHVTLCCAVEQLPLVERFYRDVLGLRVGPRPTFDFPGSWLYAGEEPIVHLAATLRSTASGPDAGSASSLAVTPGARAPTGPIDHVALRMEGSPDDWRRKLVARGVRFAEAPVPGFPLYQFFLHDPLGVKIELNFDLTR
jgi:catechol 2,3-dioxygenase-like lactoylglutathione lyase family enzyme